VVHSPAIGHVEIAVPGYARRVAESGVNAVAKAVHVLQALRRLPGGAGARELADTVGLPRSTVQRILATLADSGMLVQDPERQRYAIGPQALLIGLGYRQGLSLVGAARPILRQVRDETGETVGLSVRLGNARIFIDEVQSLAPLRFASELGRQYPLWSGANGQVLSADLSRRDLANTLDDETFAAEVFHAPDIESRARRLDRVRADGYAVAVNETMENIASVAVPIRDHVRETVAALSVSGPTSRLTAARLDEILPVLRSAARRIEAANPAPTSIPGA
jgi:DNA-binding IclR family transcriptional regulator